MDAIDHAHGNRTLEEGVIEAMCQGAMTTLPAAALASLLAAAFDRAALAIEMGGSTEDYRQALASLIGGLFRT